MKEIELRLALVFYGGVSLAIYMHGVSREVLNLVRASACRAERVGRNGVNPSKDRASSPGERAYEALLDRLGHSVDIRVVVDAVAGASAGGVNGIMLARAIAHDLPLDSHRALWLENADVTRLARPQGGIRRYLKSGISPVLDRMISKRLKHDIKDPETRDKLRTLMQSRWFSPPFSGENYSGWMLDACNQMDADYREGATLIPRGQTLDLFVTLTDYEGQVRRIHIDDPAFVEELDHRRVLNFHAKHRVPSHLQSQFGPDSVAELVFAARATSSFPGAFPPATIAEMDRVLKQRGEPWPNRDRFLSRSLELHGEGAGRRCFVDGSVVMNKPFSPVIDVIRQRPAAREVARRLVYVDPVPKMRDADDANRQPLPGFLKVILASLAHIPRNEPIGDDLRDIEARNRRGQWLSQTIAAADPVVEAAVRKILPRRGTLKTEALTRYRAAANEAAHGQAGYAFLNYESLKLHAVGEKIAQLISELAKTRGREARPELLLGWITDHLGQLAKDFSNGPPKPQDGVVQFLRGLDVDYRIRRLRFAIRKLNSLYHRAGEGKKAINPDHLDRIKSLLYEQIDHLGRRWEVDFFGLQSQKTAEVLAGKLIQRMPGGNGGEHDEVLSEALDQVSKLMGLQDLDRLQDELFSATAGALLPVDIHRELLGAYVGFAFYDLVTFPVLQSNDFSEISETLVARISPKDTGRLNDDSFQLKGAALNTFGAFFNRSWREHDYLWGRLNAAERLVGIVLSASDGELLSDTELAQIHRDLFLAILDEEELELKADPALIGALKAKIRELT
ncbi:patatin-like protein [Roseibium polysiphoniae]|uniref:Patatin-like protein n=1 Tax=Roseibium polysiphoniae TaxID=2571221 RepID=A0ABR9C675_9HYPH|nr:patatin-like protein [Roseibium polysiphoniae]MBD8875381.1 patatin-like protein [Roseibium polysiphoniae]